MYIESIHIENFRALQDVTIKFDPHFNLLIGNNGTGKSSTMEAVIIALNSYLKGVQGVKNRGISQDDIRCSVIKSGDASFISIPEEYAAITATAAEEKEQLGKSDLSEGNKVQWRRKLIVGSDNTEDEIDDLGKYCRKLMTGPRGTVLPVLAFRSDYKLKQDTKSAMHSVQGMGKNDRQSAYTGCLDGFPDLGAVEYWSMRMELSAFQQRKPVAEYEMFKDTVTFFMKKLGGLKEQPRLVYTPNTGFIYSENGRDYALNTLSSGYQASLIMVMDIAYRMVQLNPEISDRSKIPGIILIDELDMHIHPRWQWCIVSALEQTFPGMQFIAATHSPIIIASCKTENLIRIQMDSTVDYPTSAYGHSINDTLLGRQGASDVLPTLEKMNKSFNDALNQGDLEKAKTFYKKMKEEFGSDNEIVRMAIFELDEDANL